MRPLISVLLPTYNCYWLPIAVDTIIHQTVTDWQLVIVDDGSTDDTIDYLKDLRKELGSKLTIIWQPHNMGITAALNIGLQACDGIYIARMDADDQAHTKRFEEQLLLLLEHPEIDGCGTWIRFFGDEERVMEFPTDPDEVRDQLFQRTTVAHPTYFFRREIYEEFKYSPDFPHAEDLDFLLRVTEVYRLSNVPKVLLDYRVSYAESISCVHKEEQAVSANRARLAAAIRRGFP